MAARPRTIPHTDSRTTRFGARANVTQTSGYLHGYSHEEQARLIKQAEFLEFSVYEHLDLSRVRKLLEVGCGVGAQTRIVCRRFPHLHITGVDGEPAQIQAARTYLAEPLRA